MLASLMMCSHDAFWPRFGQNRKTATTIDATRVSGCHKTLKYRWNPHLFIVHLCFQRVSSNSFQVVASNDSLWFLRPHINTDDFLVVSDEKKKSVRQRWQLASCLHQLSWPSSLNSAGDASTMTTSPFIVVRNNLPSATIGLLLPNRAFCQTVS